jgi:drug/metabolite transporter (DMT)-like permease
MDILPLSLVLIGSILHLGWNILAKGAEDKLAFLWLALAPPACFGFTYLIMELNSGIDNWIPWICLLASSVIHLFYFWSLANAYKFADLSFVYPYCRGIGALLATMMGLAFLNESPSILGAIGITLAIGATFLEPLISKYKGEKISNKGLFLTIATGVAIACYLIVDKIGVTHMKYFSYLGIMFFFMFIGFLPIMLKDNRYKKELLKSKYRPFIASFFMTSGYGVVLAAMKLAPVSYVVSARATGIAISGVAGIIFFNEKVSPTRWFSIAMITIGVVLISLG